MRFVVLLNGVHRYKFSNVLSKGGTTWGEIKRALFTELTHELKFLGPTKPTINDLIWQGHKDDSRVTYARGKDAHCPLNLLRFEVVELNILSGRGTLSVYVVLKTHKEVSRFERSLLDAVHNRWKIPPGDQLLKFADGKYTLTYNVIASVMRITPRLWLVLEYPVVDEQDVVLSWNATIQGDTYQQWRKKHAIGEPDTNSVKEKLKSFPLKVKCDARTPLRLTEESQQQVLEWVEKHLPIVEDSDDSSDEDEGEEDEDEDEVRKQLELEGIEVTSNIDDALRLRYATVVTRRRIGQEHFRRKLIKHYFAGQKPRCFITGSSLVIEAAHIKPFSAGGSHALKNGMLLSANWHALFDQHHWDLEKDTLRILLGHTMRNDPIYSSYNGKILGHYDSELSNNIALTLDVAQAP